MRFFRAPYIHDVLSSPQDWKENLRGLVDYKRPAVRRFSVATCEQLKEANHFPFSSHELRDNLSNIYKELPLALHEEVSLLTKWFSTGNEFEPSFERVLQARDFIVFTILTNPQIHSNLPFNITGPGIGFIQPNQISYDYELGRITSGVPPREINLIAANILLHKARSGLENFTHRNGNESWESQVYVNVYNDAYESVMDAFSEIDLACPV